MADKKYEIELKIAADVAEIKEMKVKMGIASVPFPTRILNSKTNSKSFPTGKKLWDQQQRVQGKWQ